MPSCLKPLSLPEKCRILVISDVHGDRSLLQRLLMECGYSGEDHLILLGDMIDKGEESSSECLRYVFSLLDSNKNAQMVLGNCDNVRWLLERQDEELYYYAALRRNSILRCWAEEDGLSLARQDIPALRRDVFRLHAEEIARIDALPRALETEHFVFVHSGLKTPDYAATPPLQMVRDNDFFFSTPGIGKWIVFGHMPTPVFYTDRYCCNPYFDRRRRLIGVDGGNAIQRCGQINALIIHKAGDSIRFSTRFVDRHAKARAVRSVKGSCGDALFRSDFMNSRIERILSVNADFTLCRLSRSGRNCMVKNELLAGEKGALFVRHSCPQEFLSLAAGQEVYLMESGYSGYDLAKTLDGERIGWVRKGVLEPLCDFPDR